MLISNYAEIKDLILNGKSALVTKGEVVVDDFTINGTPSNGIKLFALGDIFISDNAVLNGNALNICVLGDIYLFGNDKKPYPLPEAPSISDNSNKLDTLNTKTIVNQCTKGHWAISPDDGIDVTYN